MTKGIIERAMERMDDRGIPASQPSSSTPSPSSLGAEEHMRKVLESLGFDLSDENLKETPARFVRYLQEFQQPYDAEKLLKSGFTSPDKYHGMVAQRGLPYRSVCSHHLLPYIGTVAVGYLPGERVVGLSKLGRLVRAVGLKSPGLQEHQTEEICDVLERVLKPRGIIVVVSCIHTCMAARGLAAAGVPTVTSSVRGLLLSVPSAREEFFQITRG